MTKYTTPADALRAARAAATTDAELHVLAQSPHSFVRAALLERPILPAGVFAHLIPGSLASAGELEVAQRLVAHPQATAALRRQVAGMVAAPNDAAELMVALSCSDVALDALQPLLERANSALRRRIEQAASRGDVRDALRQMRSRNRAAAPPPAAPPAAEPAASADAPWQRLLEAQREQVRAALAGSVLRHEDAQFDRDYSHDSAYAETIRTLVLGADGRFRYDEQRMLSVSAGDYLFSPSVRRSSEHGIWSIVFEERQRLLVLRRIDGSVVWRAVIGDLSPGVCVLDGARWRRDP
jgi:biotin carboxyl carrier protein